ncbi:MAG: hypothetical protein BWY46_01066 [Firmicutes bacterium ADurb.Bin300]|nr:MAG: hypothetical protein BWY46_01066 [Firmicutes bacterium ADurb.Bin300]HOD02027.1 hypothetical protein [Clostridiales bacterium]
MRKAPFFLTSAILIILIAAFCGCNISFVGKETDTSSDASGSSVSQNTNTDDTKKNDEASSIFQSESSKTTGINKNRITNSEGNTAQKEEDILASDTYIVKGRIETDGVITPYHIARSGEKMSLMTEMKGVNLGLISTQSSMYIISPNKKIYSNVPDILKKSLRAEIEKAASAEDRTLVSEGTKVVDGVKLDYKKFDDNSVDYSYKGVLVKQESYDDKGKQVILYIDEVSDKVSDSDFSVPSNFRKVPITDFMAAFTK